MTRVLAAAALGLGLLAAGAPAANACAWEYCPGTSIVCRHVDCELPAVDGCRYVLDQYVCI